MHVAGMLLGCLLLGAASDAHAVPPSEILTEAMQLPAGSAVVGQRLTLLAALSSTADRGQQLRIVRAYWRLVQAAADYSFSRDYVKTLERTRTTGRVDASLRLAATVASAQLHEAELGAVRAQFELAELVRLPIGSPLPLPADRPHVGAYRTSFNEMFTGRTPPEAARLSEKILPIQHLAIDDRAAAVQAADDSHVAVADNYQLGRADAAAIVASSRELLRQRRAFMETVCAYNRNIADYALTVVPPGTSPEALVSMLIGPPPQSGSPSRPGEERPVRPTSADEPIPTNPMRQPRLGQPTLAPPRSQNEPTPAPPRDGWKTNESGSSSFPDALKPVGKNEPALRPPQPDPPAEPPPILERPMVPIGSPPSASTLTPRRANKPIRPPQALGNVTGTTATALLYPALVGTLPATRAKQLTVALFWDRSLPEASGKPINLADCLMRDGNGDHLATIQAYWLVRGRAAEYQLFAGQVELLEALSPVVLDRRNDPSGAADMLRLRSAQLAAKAAMRDSEVALVEAQYALALRIGAVADAVWPLASTVPHSGDYLLKLGEQPRNLRESWPVQRLAATIPGFGQSMQQRAAAVVDADAGRVAAAEQYAAGFATIDQAIEGVVEQSEQSSAFLEAIAAYNRAIAEYATTVLPPGTPANKLAAALVAKP